MGSYVVKYDDLYRVSKEMFMRLGYSDNQASIVTNCLVEADARHLHSHGVAAFTTYMSHLKAGNLKLDAPEPSTVFETPITIVLDGHSGVGYVIADIAVKKCIEKAKSSGICITVVRNANHYGFAGHWSEMMAKHGFIGITCTNTVRCVCPTRSAERNLGTNPISVAFPVAADEPMFLLDMATCVMAHGKLCRSQIFAESGVVPDGVMIDGKGKSLTNFGEALEILHHGDDRSHSPKPDTGGLLPLGGATELHSGHKGYALALLVELLTGGLACGIPSKFIPLASEGICFFFMSIDPAYFGDVSKIREHVAHIVEEYRKTTPLDPNLPVLIPGDKERISREEALRNGIVLSKEIVDILRFVAETTEKQNELNAILTTA